MDDGRSVTWKELRYLVPIIVGTATIIFFLSNVLSKIDVMQQEVVSQATQIQQVSDTINNMKSVQAQQGQDIAVIKQILQHNNLSEVSAPKNTLALTPDKPKNSIQSAQLATTPSFQSGGSSTIFIIEPTPVPTTAPQTSFFAPPAPTPTPQPQPTPLPTPSPIICVATFCI